LQTTQTAFGTLIAISIGVEGGRDTNGSCSGFAIVTIQSKRFINVFADGNRTGCINGSELGPFVLEKSGEVGVPCAVVVVVF